MRPLKKIKMNRYIKALGLLSLALIASCKKDDDVSIAPPRDYAVQYGTEKVQIEEYLNTHYIVSVNEDFDIVIDTLDADAQADGEVSLWNQTEYPLQNKQVNLNNVDYTLYYLVLNQGGGEMPTRYDNVRVAYNGWTLDGNQFDYDPFPQLLFPLMNYIEGWHEIIPLFNAGVYDNTPSPDPANFTDFGAGVMFLPSDFGYYDSVRPNISSYSPLIFSFKLYQMETADTDNDGIPNKHEVGPDSIYLTDYDTDGDGNPNYNDADDDNDGYPTRDEITVTLDGEEVVLPFDQIPACDTGIKRHIDPSCHQE